MDSSRTLLFATLVLFLSWPCSFAAADEQPEHLPHWLVPSLHSGGVSLATRLMASALWPEAFDVTRVEENWRNFKTAWSRAPEFDTAERFFQWDHDPWVLNFFGHGIMGSEFYLRYRQAHHPPWLALGLTITWTLIWEYLIESWHKRPSGIDLIWTPGGGALLGEGRFQVYRMIQHMNPSWRRYLLFYLVDPLGQLERDLFGLHY